MKRTTRAASGGPGREMTPCYGSSGVTIVVPGASWRVVFSGRLIQTPVGGGLGPWRPLHEPLGMGETGGQAGAVADCEDGGGAAVVHVGRREVARPL